MGFGSDLRMLHKSSLDAKMYFSVDVYCLIKVVVQEPRVTLHPSVPSALCLYITEELNAGWSKLNVQSQVKAGIFS